MADERLNSIEKHAWKILSTLGLSAVIWYLNGINTSLDSLNKEIVAIKLNDSANTIRMARVEDDVVIIKNNEKELSKRVGALEKSSAQHDQQLRQLSK